MINCLSNYYGLTWFDLTLNLFILTELLILEVENMPRNNKRKKGRYLTTDNIIHADHVIIIIDQKIPTT